MKNFHFWAIIATFSLLACSKNNDSTPTPPAAANYMNMRTGSLWNYEVVNNTPPSSTSSYTLTSSNRDSVINAKNYHVFINSASGASEYYFASGSDYYTYQSLPAVLGGSKVENLYLKAGAAVNSSWSQNYTISYNSLPLTVTAVNKIEAKELTKTVNGTVYQNVIHVSTNITVDGIPPASLVTDIDYYYAPNYGMIENSSKINLNYLGIVNNSDFSTRLKTATLL